jgi:hypothetical protein
MSVITHEPLEYIPTEFDQAECEAAGCEQTDALALVTSTDDTSGVYCPDCASMLMFGGGRQ